MARSLASKPNVVAPGGAYPYGRVKNKSTPTSTDGTPITEQVYGDMHQFFEKLLADAGITANGQPENSSNGFQYNQALSAMVNTPWQNGRSPNPTNGVSVVEVFTNRYRRQGSTLTWNFCATFDFPSTNLTFELRLPVAASIASGYSQFVIPTGQSFAKIYLYHLTSEHVVVVLNGAPTGFAEALSFSLTFEIA